VSFDDGAHGPHEQPDSARRACDVLLEGNRFFVSVGEGPDARTAKWRLVRLDATDIGIGDLPDAPPARESVADVLGCACSG